MEDREQGYYWIQRVSDDDEWEISHWDASEKLWVFCEVGDLSYTYNDVHRVADRIDLPRHLKRENTNAAS